MLKNIPDELCCFDIEWVPDPKTIRAVYNLCTETSDQEAIKRAYVEAGATEDNPTPFLRTILCQIVSIAGVYRKKTASGITHKVFSFYPDGFISADEYEIINAFMNGIGKTKPVLVGFNIIKADIPILMQRALACGVVAKNFCVRPAKPWEGIDYFSKNSDGIVDLFDLYAGWGSSSLSLHQLACAVGVPGKIDTSGDQVAQLYLDGKIKEIAEYNEFDAITTFLIWLRTAKMCGLETADQEENQFSSYLKSEAEKGKVHFDAYFHCWKVIKEFKK